MASSWLEEHNSTRQFGWDERTHAGNAWEK